MKTCCGFLLATAVLIFTSGCGTGNPSTNPPGTTLGSAASSAVPLGSQLGYVWMSTDGTLRPILGVPGGSRIGASAINPRTYVAGAASSVTQLALFEDKTGTLLLQHLDAGAPVAIANDLPSSVRIAFSFAGTSAIAFAAGGNSFWQITGLPAAPQVQAVKIAGSLTEVAIHDNGAVLIVVKTDIATTISTRSSTSGPAQIASIKGFGGITFVPSSTDALVADSVTGDLFRIPNAAAPGTTTPGTIQVTAVAHGFKQPYAIGSSVDGHWALVAYTGGLTRLDLSGASPAVPISCPCTATQISPLSGPGLIRVTEPAQGPAWMVDIAAQQPQAYFIPPVVADSGSAQ